MSRGRKLVVLCCLLGACAGTETGNPSFVGELAYDAYSTQPSIAALRQGDAGAVVEQAWLVTGDVQLLDVAHCETPEDAGAHADGLGAGDHAMLGAARTRFRAGIGDYCGVALTFERTGDELPEGAPEALAGHSIVLSGTLPERSLGFRIESAYDGELVLMSDDASFELGPDQARLLIAFDVAQWLSGLMLDELEPDADGLVRIADDERPELLARFESNLGAGVELRSDPDGTGLAEDAAERLARVAD